MYISPIYTPLTLVSLIIYFGLSPIKCGFDRRRILGPCEQIEIPNVLVQYKRMKKVAIILCASGYQHVGGDSKLTCKDGKWIGTIPNCIKEKLDHQYCNFELASICDWIQDDLDDYNWIRSSGIGNAIAGSSAAKMYNTLEKPSGHYISVNDGHQNWYGKVARIFSPLIAVPKEKPACVTLWYYVNGYSRNIWDLGSSEGKLNVYLKPESLPFEVIIPDYAVSIDHGEVWTLIILDIGYLKDDLYQVVLEVVGGWGKAKYGIAVDSFKVLSGSACIEIDNEQATSTGQNTEIIPTTTETEIPTTTEEQIVTFIATSHPMYKTRPSTSWSTAPKITRSPDSTSKSTKPPSSTIRTYSTFPSESHTGTNSSSMTTYTRQSSNIPAYFSGKSPSSRQSSARTASTFEHTIKEEALTTTFSIMSSSSRSPTTITQVTLAAFTERVILPFEGTKSGLFWAAILLAVLSVATIAAILIVYWVRHIQQTDSYQLENSLRLVNCN